MWKTYRNPWLAIVLRRGHGLREEFAIWLAGIQGCVERLIPLRLVFGPYLCGVAGRGGGEAWFWYAWKGGRADMRVMVDNRAIRLRTAISMSGIQ